MALKQILNAASVTVTGSAEYLKNTGHPAVHTVTLMAHGAFAGATLKAQIGVSNSVDGLKWVDIPSGSMTATSVANFDIAEGFYFRTLLASASATATSVDAWIGIGRSTSK